MVTRLVAVSSSFGWAAIWLAARSSTKSMVCGANGSSLCTKMPSSEVEPVSASTIRKSRIWSELWSTHWTGSVWSWSFSSTATPPKKITRLATSEDGSSRGRREPSHFTSRPREPSRKSRPWVGDLYSRMPSVASGTMMLVRQMTAMPTASSRPKSRIIGTLAKRRQMKAKTASKVTTRSAGQRLRAVSWIGVAHVRSITTSSSTRACIWIA